MNLFVTGGSGFLGTAVIPYLVEDRLINQIYLLIRGTAKANANERLIQIIEKIFPPKKKKHCASKTRRCGGGFNLRINGIK
jgi:thioester reductase-like protein